MFTCSSVAPLPSHTTGQWLTTNGQRVVNTSLLTSLDRGTLTGSCLLALRTDHLQRNTHTLAHQRMLKERLSSAAESASSCCGGATA